MGGDSSSKTTCKYCGSQDIEYSDIRGETICCHCGGVLEENAMVEGLQFMEGSGGAVTMVGQFISSSGNSRGLSSLFLSRENREQVLQRGYSNLQRIADYLRLSNQHVESAQRVYLMAVQRNFTTGRRNLFVATACLYTICRREKTPHMLIDFSDVVQTSIRSLGQVFMKLLRLLHLQVPHVDPSLFMERFASQMSLGDKMNMVAATGVRLIQAMTRDWLCTGRRPTGLCGSALLIAARYHGFCVNAEDIAHIVRVSSPTLMRRLSEFKRTSTAQLTAAEFEGADLTALPILRGPPCLENATSSRKRKLLALGNESTKDNEITGSIEDDSLHIQRASIAEESLKGGIRILATQDELCNSNPTPGEIQNLASRLINAVDEELNKRSNHVLTKISNDDTHAPPEASSIDANKHYYNRLNNADSAEEVAASSLDLHSDSLASNFDPLSMLLRDVQKKASEIIGRSERSSGNPIGGGKTSECVATLERRSAYSTSLGGAQIVSSNAPFDGSAGRVNSDDLGFEDGMAEDIEDSLSDVDDSLVASLLLDETEVDAKALIWDEMTKDIMPEVNRRLLELKQRQMESSNKKLPKTTRKTPYEYPQALTPAESVKMALNRSGKCIVNRINDDVLESLFSRPMRIIEE